MVSPLLMIVAAASGIGLVKIYVYVLPAIREKKMKKVMDELSNPDGSIAWGLFKAVYTDWCSGARFKTADEYMRSINKNTGDNMTHISYTDTKRIIMEELG